MVAKLSLLEDYFRALGSAAIAFSGGVDSSFLLKIAHGVLGEKAVAVTEKSHLLSSMEEEEGAAFCKKNGIRQIFIEENPLLLEEFRENPKNRCYFCKKNLFTKIKELALKNNLNAVCEGSNADDLTDYRPGLKAVEELGIKSPLRELGFSKAEIREASKELSLTTWNKPSKACLASRIPYGEVITEKKLNMVEKAESFLFTLGLFNCRVRIHGETLARIEIEEKFFSVLLENKDELLKTFKNLGFLYVTLDLQGFRSGSLNEVFGASL